MGLIISCRHEATVPRPFGGAAPLLFTEGLDHESVPHRLPGLDRDLGRVVGHSHRDLEPDHLVGAMTQTTELVRSRPDCQINADSNRCREDRPPLNTGRFIAWIKDWYTTPNGSSPG
jgi:hypothetical protein